MKTAFIKSLFLTVSTLYAVLTYGQSQLEVRCYNDASVYNQFLIDGNTIEYSVCFPNPAFYVGVIEPSTCSAWGTNYNGANPDHSFGNFNETQCRPRVEYFFVFDQADSLQLAGMLNMLQQIPQGHSLFIYTPISYNFATVSAANSNLTDELSSRWDANVIEGDQIMVLYGEQGNSGSFVTDTTVNQDGYISFNRTICNSGLTLEENLNTVDLLISASLNQLILNPELKFDGIEVFDALGRKTDFEQNENVLTFDQSVEAGVYLIRANVNGQAAQLKVMLGN